MRVQTVGDQIFALTTELKRLKKLCQQYEAHLRRIEGQKPNHHGIKLASELPTDAIVDTESEPALN